MTSEITGKTYQVFSIPFGFEGKMRAVLRITDPEKREVIHYDKKRSKTVFNHPHNVGSDTSTPKDWLEMPYYLDKMMEIHNIKYR